MKELRKVSQKELNEILELHKLWLETEGEEGTQADLSYCDLRCTDLSYCDLRSADLTKANLANADLRNVDLTKANLANADLTKANLAKADLSYADLRYAILRYAILRYADLSYCDLTNANLFCAKVDNMINVENVGTENRVVYYFYKDDRVICESFDNTLEEFKKAVTEKYGSDYGSYSIEIEMFEKMKDTK